MQRSLLFSVIAFWISFQNVAHAQDITTGLVARWTFCGCSTKDQTGHGHDGVASGNPACVPGYFDQAYLFNGTNTIDVPYDAAFNIADDGALTLTAWVKPTNLNGQYQAFFVKGVDFWDYGLYINAGTPKFMFGCQAPNHETFSKTTPQNNQWYFVAGVYDNHKWKLYVNGLPEDSIVNGSALYQSTNGIGFAKKGAYRRDFFTGLLDELRMYNRALSDAEVLQLYRYQPVGSGLTLSASIQNISQHGCFGIDTSVNLNILGGCGSGTGTLDSLWLTGSPTFMLRNAPKYPSTIATIDSIRVRYASANGSTDTSFLHIRYDLGSGVRDTIVTLIGKGYTENPYLYLSTGDEYIVQRNCTAVDTFVSVSVLGRCIGTGTLDSVWLSGSAMFSLIKGQALPRGILPKDFVGVRYAPQRASDDTAVLHLRYDIGGGIRDTTITLAGKGHPDNPTVTFSTSKSGFSQRTCKGVDTSLTIQVFSCRTDTIRVDTFWVSGSASFTATQHAFPWRISASDLLRISYASHSRDYDTATLHIRYVFAGQQTDTTIMLVGLAASPFLSGRSYQHLAVRSGTVGDLVTIPMQIDLGDTAALKSTWPNLKSITSTFSFDRTKLAFVSISAPAGWAATSVNSLGNAMRITITNVSGSYARPLTLGDAIFKIIDPTQGMTQVSLDNLSLRIGQTDNEVCLGQTEDALWGIVVKPEAGVDKNKSVTLLVQPNPFDDHIRIKDEGNELASVEMLDILGHRILMDISDGRGLKDISTDAIPAGPYLLICHTRYGAKSFRLNKVR